MLDFAVFAEAFFFDVLADSCCRLMLAHSGLQAWQTLPSSWLFDRWAGSHASFGSGRGLKWNERDQTPITHSMSGMSCHEFMTRFDDPAMILPDRSTDIGGFLHLLLWLVVLCGFNMFQHVSTIFHSTLTCCITYSDIFVYIHIYIYIHRLIFILDDDSHEFISFRELKWQLRGKSWGSRRRRKQPCEPSCSMSHHRRYKVWISLETREVMTWYQLDISWYKLYKVDMKWIKHVGASSSFPHF